MKGIITAILSNGNGQEYGFIGSEGEDYYFDNRYLAEGSMSDFYVDDIIDFQSGTNSYNPNQKVAKDVKLDLGDFKSKKVLPMPKTVAALQGQVNYYPPEQEASQVNNWFIADRSSKLVLHNFSKNEEIIFDKLKSIFYHTNAGHFKTRNKGINYGYGLFGPTKQFVIQLGLEKVEFAMILCDSQDFQRRTLEESFLYLTHYIIPKVRISGHFYILATEYPDIIAQIEKPDIQGALQYSIIPFSYSELLATPSAEYERLFINRFKKFLFERDFFSYSEPINDRLFLFGGRDLYAKAIADRSVSGDHSGIFGLRKSGKTSIVNMVKQELEQREVLYISYRCVEFAGHNWYEAAFKIVRDLYKKSGQDLPDRVYAQINGIEFFTEDIDNLITLGHKHIVLIFDEIEQISIDSTFDEKWQDAMSFHLFWSAIITFCEKYPGKLALIIAGINPSISEMDQIPTKDGKASPRNPIYKKLSNDSYLKPFVYEQTKRMVNILGKYMGYNFDDEVCFELQKDFGGHPYFTRQMCKTIVEYVRHEGLQSEDGYLFIVTRPLYSAVKNSGSFEIASIQWCKDILRELQICYPHEYKLLLNIANRDVSTVEQVRRSMATIPHLVGYGLVRFDPASKEMEIAIDVVKNFLVKEKEYQKPFSEMSSHEIDDEIQDGISMCEQPLRKLIKDVLFAQLSRAEAAEFIRLTQSFARDNSGKTLNDYTVQKLLDPRLVILHFSTLKDIICGRDNKYKNHFDTFKNTLYPYTKQEIEAYLNNIYVARNTADHHFQVHNEGTLLNFRASLFEIKKMLKDLEYIE